jgi:hypothetical protein
LLPPFVETRLDLLQAQRLLVGQPARGDRTLAQVEHAVLCGDEPLRELAALAADARLHGTELALRGLDVARELLAHVVEIRERGARHRQQRGGNDRAPEPEWICPPHSVRSVQRLGQLE